MHGPSGFTFSNTGPSWRQGQCNIDKIFPLRQSARHVRESLATYSILCQGTHQDGFAAQVKCCIAAGIAAAVMLVDAGSTLAADAGFSSETNQAQAPSFCLLGCYMSYLCHNVSLNGHRRDNCTHSASGVLSSKIHRPELCLCACRCRNMAMCPSPMMQLPPGGTERADTATCHLPGRWRPFSHWRRETCSQMMRGRGC